MPYHDPERWRWISAGVGLPVGGAAVSDGEGVAAVVALGLASARDVHPRVPAAMSATQISARARQAEPEPPRSLDHGSPSR